MALSQPPATALPAADDALPLPPANAPLVPMPLRSRLRPPRSSKRRCSLPEPEQTLILQPSSDRLGGLSSERSLHGTHLETGFTDLSQRRDAPGPVVLADGRSAAR